MQRPPSSVNLSEALHSVCVRECPIVSGPGVRMCGGVRV